MEAPETELLQRNSLDLRQLLLCQMVLEAVAGEEVEADPRGHATRSAFPLQRVGPRDPRVLQALHAFSGIVPFLLHLAGVDNVNDVVDSYGSLCDVGGDDDFGDTFRWTAEHRLLLLVRQGGM